MRFATDSISTPERLAALICVSTLSLVSIGCSGSASAPSPKAQLEPQSWGTLEQVHVLGGVYLAGQPQPDDLRLAHQDGIRTVVSLRKHDELDWNEAALVAELGMEYRHLPFRDPAELDDAIFSQARSLLANASPDAPLLLHCGSGNRVGALWLAHRVLDHGLSFDEALSEAQSVGLKTSAYLDRAKQYIESNP